MVMRRLACLAAITLAVVATTVPAVAEAKPPRNEQGEVRKDIQEGVLTLREIERRVLPLMTGMEYLGPEYDPVAMAYRLKFIRSGVVVFVDVDARSGQILHRSR
jgi:hypothetical protein